MYFQNSHLKLSLINNFLNWIEHAILYWRFTWSFDDCSAFRMTYPSLFPCSPYARLGPRSRVLSSSTQAPVNPDSSPRTNLIALGFPNLISKDGVSMKTFPFPSGWITLPSISIVTSILGLAFCPSLQLPPGVNISNLNLYLGLEITRWCFLSFQSRR